MRTLTFISCKKFTLSERRKGDDPIKVLILGGAGVQGSASAWDLIKNLDNAEVILADIDGKTLEKKAEWLNSDRVSTRTIDGEDDLRNAIFETNCDVVINSVPWTVSIPPVEAAVEAGVDLIDYGLYQNREFDERMDEFDKKAKEAGVTIIPSCGVAPGLTNMLAAYGAVQLDEVDKIRIYVGGIPENPEPPLYYKAVWSLNGVWTQFFEDCRIIVDGELTEVDACTGIENLEFDDIGSLEAAYTDGLGTLLHMYEDPIFEGVEEVFEKTARYPGHYEKVMTLKDCGLLDNDPMNIRGVEISPRKFLTDLLTPKLTMEDDERDVTVLRVKAIGKKDGKEKSKAYEMVDYRDLESGILSMGRTTGYTGSILAPRVYSDEIAETGVVEPEHLGADEELFEKLLEDYAERNIKVEEIPGE